MRSWMLLVAAALVGCSGRTEAGPIGQALELRQYLPDSLRSTSPTSAGDSTFRQQIPVGPDSARVEMVWTSFQHDSSRLLSSVSARLIAPVQYDSLTLGNISQLHNDGTKTRAIESANAQIGWFKRGVFGHKAGVMNFGFNAMGRRIIGPSAAR